MAKHQKCKWNPEGRREPVSQKVCTSCAPLLEPEPTWLGEHSGSSCRVGEPPSPRQVLPQVSTSMSRIVTDESSLPWKGVAC